VKKLIVALVIAGLCSFTLGCGGGTTSGSKAKPSESKPAEPAKKTE
jgi:hypothetical protein